MTDDNEQKAIEEEFSQSWDWTEQYLAGLSSKEHLNWIKPIHGLIGELRSRGYDHKFRAGQSLHSFILSRSREHGMRLEQPSVSFMLNDKGGMIVNYRVNNDTVVKFEVTTVEITPEIEALLTRLLAQPID